MVLLTVLLTLTMISNESNFLWCFVHFIFDNRNVILFNGAFLVVATVPRYALDVMARSGPF